MYASLSMGTPAPTEINLHGVFREHKEKMMRADQGEFQIFTGKYVKARATYSYFLLVVINAATEDVVAIFCGDTKNELANASGISENWNFADWVRQADEVCFPRFS